MPTLVIVGAQWGDEAKGKIVDVLADDADMVVRYSGGNNAGHTVIVDRLEFRFHILPVGVIHHGCTAVLAAGMVICPKSLTEEIRTTLEKAPKLGRILISRAAHVVLPYHRLLDQLEEDARGANKIGTTSRGIGPAYTDKVQRTGIRMGEFVDPLRFRVRLAEVVAVKNRMLEMSGEPLIDGDALFEEYSGYARELVGLVGDAEHEVQAAVSSGRRVMFEGAQGAMLDLDLGTYPYVTSSHPIAGGACLGTGIGPRDIDSVLGVCKAYATRVGAGPFPTELDNAIGERIREQGHEYGTTTGRPRRCGWLDLVALRQSVAVNSMSGLVLTRLDVLSGLERVNVAVQYRLRGELSDRMPVEASELAAVEPVYQEVAGWEGDLRCARKLGDLPREARDYLDLVESLAKAPIAILSIGPDRSETIVVRPELIWG